MFVVARITVAVIFAFFKDNYTHVLLQVSAVVAELLSVGSLFVKER